MKFRIENVGKVQFAEIELNGLTVLTGENSIGKSAIGKAIFSLVKSRNGVIERFDEDTLYDVTEFLSEMSLMIQSDEKYQVNRISIPTGYILSVLSESKIIKPLIGNTIIQESISTLNKFIETLSEEGAVKEKAMKYVKLTQQKLDKFTDEEKLLVKNFNHLLQHVFRNEFNNKLAPEKSAYLSLFFSEKKINLVEVKNNESISFKAELFMPLRDATIVESPIVATLFSFIRNSMAFGLGRNQSLTYKGLPYYIFDLMEKLSRANGKIANKEVFESIAGVIGGEVAFDRLGNNFTFTDDTSNSYSILNTASGIKTFGLLQLLLSANCLYKQSLLIIDEPEVHLHPLWQLEYAKILVQLAKAGVPILLASHSPYFIEALKIYSDKEIPEKTKFYFGEMQEKGSVFKDVTSDLEPIFELLATPMQKLIIEK
ncbi:MAG: AAA family ATPase [Chitinophagales bacterium]